MFSKQFIFPFKSILRATYSHFHSNAFCLFAYVNNIKHFPFTSIEVKKIPLNVGTQRRNVISEPTFRIRRLKPRSQKL